MIKKDLDSIRDYIEKHGFKSESPQLTPSLHPEVFLQHYYDKKTLVAFCRERGIPTEGLKNALTQRIIRYLSSGKAGPFEKPKRPFAAPDSEGALHLDMKVVHYKSNPKTRVFLSQHIPGFKGFSAYVLKWIKERLDRGDMFTYGDIITEYKRFINEKAKARASGQKQSVAHDSCQYNQFLIDYSADKTFEKLHTAKEAWLLVRNSAGEKTYCRYKNTIVSILRKVLSSYVL